MLSRDKVGRAILTSLLAWSEHGPARPVTAAERKALTGCLMPGLTDADFGRGLIWASGSTGVPPIADSGPLEVSPELAASIARVLTEGGDGPPTVPPELPLAMVAMVNEADALQIAEQAWGNGFPDLAEAGFAKAAAASDEVLALRSAGNLCVVLTDEGRYGEAISACDAAVKRFPAPGPDADGALASLLYNRAVALRTRNEGQPAQAAADPAGDAAASFAAVAAKFADSQDTRARELAARARLNEAAIYVKADDGHRALQACDSFLEVFDCADPCPWWDAVASVLVNRANALVILGRSQEASAVCDEVYRRFDSVPDPVFGTIVARATILQGRVLAKLGDRKGAISAYRRSSRYSEREGHLGQVATQAGAEARVLEVEELKEELADYDAFLAQPPEAGDPSDRLRRAAVTVNRGKALSALGRDEDAITNYEPLIGDLRDDPDPELRVQLAMAMTNSGNSHRALGRDQRAMELYREVEDKFADSGDSRLVLRAVFSALNEGAIYASGGGDGQAISEYRRVSERYGAAAADDVRDVAVSALWNIVLLTKGPDLAGAAANMGEMVIKFGADESAKIRRRVAGYATSLALTAARQDDLAVAAQMLAIATVYLIDPDPDVRDVAVEAHQVRASLGIYR